MVVSPGDPIKFYQKVKKIGQGASGSVYVAKRISDSVPVSGRLWYSLVQHIHLR
jgi:protein-serine/threonine kinase